MIKKTNLFLSALITIFITHAEIDELLLEACRSHHIQNVEFCFYDFLANKPKSIIVPINNNIDDIE
jgi:hypothetical protein